MTCLDWKCGSMKTHHFRSNKYLASEYLKEYSSKAPPVTRLSGVTQTSQLCNNMYTQGTRGGGG